MAETVARRAALYLRVSTKGQTIENQRIELTRVASAKGWRIEVEYRDEAVSGAWERDRRPGYDNMLMDATRAKFDVLMCWDVSRLGRSLTGLVQALDELHSNKLDLYLHQQALDTTTPSGKAMFQMCGVFAEFERAIIRGRVLAGISRARAMGKPLGRPRAAANIPEIRQDRLDGLSIRAIAKKHGISVGKIHKCLEEHKSSVHCR